MSPSAWPASYDAAGRQTKADLPGTDRHDLYL